MPRSWKRRPDPATRSRTVLETTVSPASASAATRRNVHGDAGDIVALQLDLTDVQPAAHRNAERPHRFANGGGTAHGTGGAIKGRHEPIAQIFDLLAAEAGKLLPHRASWRSSKARHCRSPTSAARFVESTMSVNMTVASTRSTSG